MVRRHWSHQSQLWWERQSQVKRRGRERSNARFRPLWSCKSNQVLQNLRCTGIKTYFQLFIYLFQLFVYFLAVYLLLQISTVCLHSECQLKFKQFFKEHFFGGKIQMIVIWRENSNLFLKNTFLARKFKKYLFGAKIQMNVHYFGGKIQIRFQ